MLKRAEQLARRPRFDYDDWLVIVERAAATAAANAAEHGQRALGPRAQSLRAKLAAGRDDDLRAALGQTAADADGDLPPAAA
jgi:hypothetical protein